MSNRTGTCYLQVVGYNTRSKWDSGSLTVVRATQTKPSVIEPDAILVKIKLVVPDEAFRPLEPSAEVVVPLSLVQHEVSVTAEGD